MRAVNPDSMTSRPVLPPPAAADSPTAVGVSAAVVCKGGPHRLELHAAATARPATAAASLLSLVSEADPPLAGGLLPDLQCSSEHVPFPESNHFRQTPKVRLFRSGAVDEGGTRLCQVAPWRDAPPRPHDSPHEPSDSSSVTADGLTTDEPWREGANGDGVGVAVRQPPGNMA